jgi:hypothetical protein
LKSCAAWLRAGSQEVKDESDDIESVPMNRVAVTAFVYVRRRGSGCERMIQQPGAADRGRLIGVYLLFAIKVVQQWEKVALLRLGRYVGLRGPGWFHVVPVFETISPMSTSGCACTA